MDQTGRAFRLLSSAFVLLLPPLIALLIPAAKLIACACGAGFSGSDADPASVLALLGAVVLTVICARRYLRYTMLSGAELTESDRRAPILYLRPFNMEGRRPLWGWLFNRSLEHRLERSWSDYGPVVEIAPPSERVPNLGPHSIPGGDHWQLKVESLASAAQAIVLHAAIKRRTNAGKGIAWESRYVATLPPERVCLFVGDTRSSYSEFRKQMGGFFQQGLPAISRRTLFIVFDRAWRPIEIRRSLIPLWVGFASMLLSTLIVLVMSSENVAGWPLIFIANFFVARLTTFNFALHRSVREVARRLGLQHGKVLSLAQYRRRRRIIFWSYVFVAVLSIPASTHFTDDVLARDEKMVFTTEQREQVRALLVSAGDPATALSDVLEHPGRYYWIQSWLLTSEADRSLCDAKRKLLAPELDRVNFLRVFAVPKLIQHTRLRREFLPLDCQSVERREHIFDRETDGITILQHHIVWYDTYQDEDSVRALLELLKDGHLSAESLASAALMAAATCRPALITQLSEAGLDFNPTDAAQQSPARIAAARCAPEVTDLLAQKSTRSARTPMGP